MTTLGDSEPVHIVDGDRHFCDENVDCIIKRSAELSAPNARYAVVSIVGAQNSGKSYLLNHLFGTKFPVMDAKLGWEKTTTGIMISRCIAPPLLLLDVEGFDGIESEEDPLFEKQAALFALTVSDLMIVNMNIGDIGRQQGSGSQLFTTIFQEMTKIEKGGFTKILVVLRNSNGETPPDLLRNKILKRLQQIWERANSVSLKFEDHIKIDIFEMPHKDSAEFPKEVTVLRRLLSENRSAKVPASSFSKSSRILWEAIKENKKLNIPSHQVLIARSYCQGIVEATRSAFHSREDYKRVKAEESPIIFKKIADALLESIKIEYDTETEMYDPKVRVEERKHMVEELSKIFTEDGKELIWRVQQNTLEQYKDEFDKNIKNKKEADADKYAEQIVDQCMKTFISSFEDRKFVDSTYLERIYGELKTKMKSHTDIQILAIKEEKTRKELEKIKSIAGVAIILARVGAAALGAGG